MRIHRGPAGWTLRATALLSICLALPTESLAQVHFEDRTGSFGFDYDGQTFGASIGDFDGDGWPDIWIGNHLSPPHLLINQQDGTFLDAGRRVFRLAPGLDSHAASWADYDGDGDLDLILLVGAVNGTGERNNVLFEQHQGRLVDVARSRRVTYGLGRGRTPLWLDWDANGKLDLGLINKLRPDAMAPTTVLLRRGKKFRPGPIFPGLVDASNHAYGQLADLTGNGQLDLLVGGDRSGLSVFEIGVEPPRDLGPQLGLLGLHAADTAAADFDGDLRTDLFVASRHKRAPDRLLLQSDQGFEDASLGIPSILKTTSVVAADFDNDMDVDLYLVQTLGAENLPNVFLENLGGALFAGVPDAAGAAGSERGRGDSAIVLDYGLDGFLDLLLTNGKNFSAGNFGPLQLFENTGNANHWILLDLEGTVSNREGIGARVLLTAGGVTQLREQGGGSHNFCQNHSRIHFGLGSNTEVEHLEIHWPSGIVQILSNLSADHVVHVVEQEP